MIPYVFFQYPTTESFLSSVKAEVEHQVKRLQYHPSLAIWATNNENEAALAHNWFGSNVSYPIYARDYVELYIHTILEYVNVLDPSRACLPSSPTNGKQSELEGWLAENPYATIYGDGNINQGRLTLLSFLTVVSYFCL